MASFERFQEHPLVSRMYVPPPEDIGISQFVSDNFSTGGMERAIREANARNNESNRKFVASLRRLFKPFKKLYTRLSS